MKKLKNTIEDKKYVQSLLDSGINPKATFSLGCFTTKYASGFKIIDYIGEITSIDLESGYLDWNNELGNKMYCVNIDVVTLHSYSSTLLKVVKGDRVKCKYGNSGNKLWSELLEQKPTVDKIKFDVNAGFCRFTFKEDDRVDNYFYENDFEKL